jgi:sortase A
MGAALVVTGLTILGYVAWQIFGTHIVSQHKQQEIVERTLKAWTIRAQAPVETGAVRHRTAEALLRIPSFGRDYVIPIQQGTSDSVLAEGYGHFSSTANPGEVGNYALAAHRITHGQPLRDMPSLRPGDIVVIATRARTFTYRMTTNPNQLIVPRTDVWVLAPLPRNPATGGAQPDQRAGQRLITLTTCSELFHTNDRMVAFGQLVNSARR